MSKIETELDEAAIFQRFDRSTPDALLRSIAREFIRLSRANLLLAARVAALESLQDAPEGAPESGDEAAISFASNPEPLQPGIKAVDEQTPAPPAPTLAREMILQPTDSFSGAVGLYELEYDPLGAYRWSGPDASFSFHLPLDRSAPVSFALSFDRFFTDASVDRLECLVDGQRTAIAVQPDGAGHVAHGVAPAHDSGGGMTLTFVCPEIGSPQDIGEADGRRLGLIFRQLTLKQAAPRVEGSQFHEEMR